MHCPLCGGKDIHTSLYSKDHFLTGELFNVAMCGICKTGITSPQPKPSEVFHYYQSDKYVSHNDSTKGLVNFAYQQVKKITLRQKLNLIIRCTPNKDLLDFGSGTGDFLLFAKQNGFNTIGVEPDDNARNIATAKGLQIYKPEWIKNQKGQYGAITLWHVLEHTYDPIQTILELKNLLVQNGTIIIAVPNHASYDANKYGEYWAAYDLPRHLFHFHPESMKVLAEKTNLTLIETLPMKFDSFYVSMLSEKYKGGNILSGLYSGLLSNIKATKTGNYSSLIYVFQKQDI